MQTDCLLCLKKMSAIPIFICDSICSGKMIDTDSCLKKSAEIGNSCIKQAIKQFIPPFDREDITTISLMVHRLIIDLCLLAEYKNRYFLKEDLTKQLSPVCSICKNNLSVFESGFPDKPIQNILTDRLAPQYFEYAINNKYNPYDTILRQGMFDKTEACYNRAADISDYITRTIIKNT